MNCKKCGSNRVTISTNVYTKSKSRSFIWNLLMTCLTSGLWLLWILIRKRKEKTVREKTACCQECGYSWNIK